MAKITKLSQDVIGKIAAGEVVERPAAAIKELTENSMDAGASAITIEIKDGGISYIRVTDNGCGIPTPEIRMAFERHATSKIEKAEDLHNIHTLGFRGEALASIAAVSRVTLTTRTAGDDHGVKVYNEGGAIQDIREAACPEGTTFVIEDLFFNTPVRLKFLKKPAQEAALVSDLVMRLILSRPDISFRFISQGKVVYHSAGDGKMDSAVFSIYGREMLSSMRFIQGAGGGMAVTGYVGIGDSARGNRGHQSFFINGRYMKSPLLSKALEQGARERVTIGHFPLCVLYLTMAYDKVDVNVHPNKLEVRFQDEQMVFEALRDMVQEALSQDTTLNNIPRMTFEIKGETQTPPVSHAVVLQTPPSDNAVRAAQAPEAKPAQPQIPVAPPEPTRVEEVPVPVIRAIPPGQEAQPVTFRETYQARSTTPPAAPGISPPPTGEKAAPEPEVQQEVFFSREEAAMAPDLRILGVVFGTYILIEYGEQLLLIDQHAAHERLLYDKMIVALDKQAASQALLVGEIVSLTHREYTVLMESLEALRQTGFEIEPFGDNAVKLSGVPLILGQPQTAKAFLLEVLDDLENAHGLSTLEKRRSAIIQMACKRAVKGGERLPEAEIAHLVEKTTETGVTPTCPHGRPLVIAITKTDLEKRFKRIQ